MDQSASFEFKTRDGVYLRRLNQLTLSMRQALHAALSGGESEGSDARWEKVDEELQTAEKSDDDQAAAFGLLSDEQFHSGEDTAISPAIASPRNGGTAAVSGAERKGQGTASGAPLSPTSADAKAAAAAAAVAEARVRANKEYHAFRVIESKEFTAARAVLHRKGRAYKTRLELKAAVADISQPKLQEALNKVRFDRLFSDDVRPQPEFFVRRRGRSSSILRWKSTPLHVSSWTPSSPVATLCGE